MFVSCSLCVACWVWVGVCVCSLLLFTRFACSDVVVCDRYWFVVAGVDCCILVADVGCIVCCSYVWCVVLDCCCALCAARSSLSLRVVGCRCGMLVAVLSVEVCCKWCCRCCCLPVSRVLM